MAVLYSQTNSQNASAARKPYKPLSVYCDMSSGDYIQMNASGETVVIGDWYVEKRERVRTREKW